MRYAPSGNNPLWFKYITGIGVRKTDSRRVMDMTQERQNLLQYGPEFDGIFFFGDVRIC